MDSERANQLTAVEDGVQVVEGNTVFANNLYQIISKKETGNILFSPISVHIALCMIYQGARGNTAAMLGKILNIPEAKIAALGYKWLMVFLNSIENVTLLMANKIYAKEKLAFFKEFEDSMRNDFSSEVEMIDFEKKEMAVQLINGWASQKTNGKITSLIDENFLDEETSLILLNAIYFKGDWATKFNSNSTVNDTFYIENDKTVDVQMMINQNRFDYSYNEALEASILALPYKNETIKMVIFLPTENDGIKALEEKLVGVDLIKLATELHPCRVKVSLPKFRIEAKLDLDDILKEMGLGVVFDEDKADFGKMTELNTDENQCVDAVVQKAFIEVNEEGAEAAAVTVVKMKIVKKSLPRIIQFKVDHPAILMLVATVQNVSTILFLGRLCHPEY